MSSSGVIASGYCVFSLICSSFATQKGGHRPARTGQSTHDGTHGHTGHVSCFFIGVALNKDQNGKCALVVGKLCEHTIDIMQDTVCLSMARVVAAGNSFHLVDFHGVLPSLCLAAIVNPACLDDTEQPAVEACAGCKLIKPLQRFSSAV
jgi:hypothetical protein